MTEKTEWEIVDAPLPHARPTLQQLLQALLGAAWRWKLAGYATIAGLLLAFLAALVGIMLLLVPVAAIALIGVARIRRWLHRDPGPHLPAKPKQ